MVWLDAWIIGAPLTLAVGPRPAVQWQACYDYSDSRELPGAQQRPSKTKNCPRPKLAGPARVSVRHVGKSSVLLQRNRTDQPCPPDLLEVPCPIRSRSSSPCLKRAPQFTSSVVCI